MRIRKSLSILQYSILVLLIAATAVFFTACGDAEQEADGAEITVIVEVVDPDGASTEHTLTTTALNLADALLEAGFVSGEDSAYGLYIKTVDGVTADYDVDGSYWSLLKDGEYLMTGASDTPIADGEHYELVYESAFAEAE